jgi:uncharacterized repeat protein (TIGR03803 family)
MRGWTRGNVIMINRLHGMTLAALLVLATLAQAQTFTTLYSFTGGADGNLPEAGVIQDAAGNLYGTTWWGGYQHDYPFGYGVVYEVNSSGTETVLHTFCTPSQCYVGNYDGMWPITAVVRDKAGNFYGTTNGGVDYGTVFKIDPKGNETVLYNFYRGSGSAGCLPAQGLITDNSGNLFGTTSECGSTGYPGSGTIFKMDSAGTLTVLHTFVGSDGAYPYYGHLAMDRNGVLYGVTAMGGAYNAGVLYKLTKDGRFAVLHSFGGTSDGCYPWGTVAMDKTGNLYGTTHSCGSHGYGTIWKVSTKRKETILHNFAGYPSDGCYPFASVAQDSKGALYGVTSGCGANNWGALYELSASGKLTLLHSFSGTDGEYPYGEVLLTAKGKLFGTTTSGGAYGYGTVWSYVP